MKSSTQWNFLESHGTNVSIYNQRQSWKEICHPAPLHALYLRGKNAFIHWSPMSNQNRCEICPSKITYQQWVIWAQMENMENSDSLHCLLCNSQRHAKQSLHYTQLNSVSKPCSIPFKRSYTIHHESMKSAKCSRSQTQEDLIIQCRCLIKDQQ